MTLIFKVVWIAPLLQSLPATTHLFRVLSMHMHPMRVDPGV